MNRSELLQKSKTQKEWDILIIGGGATGLGAAVDAASRGFKTLLLEQADFAKGTSSKATKLIHGGVRYLAQGNIKLVREALKERALLLQNANHVCSEMDFIIPCYSFWDTIKYGIGLKLYDWLSGKYSLGKTKIIDKNQTKKLLGLNNTSKVFAGICYKDGQFDDARLAIHLAQTAVLQGAVVLNYCKVVSFIKEDDKIVGVKAVDQIHHTEMEFRAKIVINATGVFVNDVIKMDNLLQNELVTPSQGIHLVINHKYFKSASALMIPKTKDGRVLFAVPWHNVVVIGTTDTPIKNIDPEPIALQEEIDFLIDHFNQYTNAAITKKDIQSVFVGLRPLVKKHEVKKTAALSRDHCIVVATSSLLTITGGKWTTYRKMAEDVVDKAIPIANLTNKKCITETLSIYGNMKNSPSEYGTDEAEINKLISENSIWKTKLVDAYHYTQAHVIFAIRKEMAERVEDVLARRTRIMFLNANDAVKIAPLVAQMMAKEMNKDEQWEENQLQDFRALASKYIVS